MIGKILKKLIGSKKSEKLKDSPLDQETKASEEKLLSKAQTIFDFISKKFQEAISESKIIREKLKNLHKTNYELGLYHLEKGNIGEAIFRFKIVRKFWPHDYDAHLKLIYCFCITGNFERANFATKYLLSLDPNFRAEIENLINDASFRAKINDNFVTNKIENVS